MTEKVQKTQQDEKAPDAPANQVTLRGRISSEPDLRELPSGATLLAFRLVVTREATPMTRASKQSSDWVDCAVWGGRVRASAASWQVNDVVEIRGSLRRRYFRSVGSPASATRVEVEVLGGKMLKRAAASDGQESRRAQSQ